MFKRFEVFDPSGKPYGFVKIPKTALQNGWEQPKYVVLDEIICTADGKGGFTRDENKPRGE